ncbi:MAG: hypothetical protein KJO24_02345, partial [Gammaproteobacteria bacterium]|nr:hypothetical protein [Gammaproteobacteria bacterium]
MAQLKLLNLLLLACLLSKQVLAADLYPPPSHLFIGEHVYALNLRLNDRLLATLRPAKQALGSYRSAGAHYQGKLIDGHNGWLRVSQIEGRWQGLASVESEVYAVAMNEQGLLTGTPIVTGSVPVCAMAQEQEHQAQK